MTLHDIGSSDDHVGLLLVLIPALVLFTLFGVSVFVWRSRALVRDSLRLRAQKDEVQPISILPRPHFLHTPQRGGAKKAALRRMMSPGAASSIKSKASGTTPLRGGGLRADVLARRVLHNPRPHAAHVERRFSAPNLLLNEMEHVEEAGDHDDRTAGVMTTGGPAAIAHSASWHATGSNSLSRLLASSPCCSSRSPSSSAHKHASYKPLDDDPIIVPSKEMPPRPPPTKGSSDAAAKGKRAVQEVGLGACPQKEQIVQYVPLQSGHDNGNISIAAGDEDDAADGRPDRSTALPTKFSSSRSLQQLDGADQEQKQASAGRTSTRNKTLLRRMSDLVAQKKQKSRSKQDRVATNGGSSSKSSPPQKQKKSKKDPDNAGSSSKNVVQEVSTTKTEPMNTKSSAEQEVEGHLPPNAKKMRTKSLSCKKQAPPSSRLTVPEGIGAKSEPLGGAVRRGSKAGPMLLIGGFDDKSTGNSPIKSPIIGAPELQQQMNSSASKKKSSESRLTGRRSSIRGGAAPPPLLTGIRIVK
mmetsp:Transcript_4285/g.10438  ORF Transcript_4285/g.10438 Transcript_4285/m.10438 type:complete len:526 (+) Transcript_4285:252-1829(+)|eukprot:CAMPEP_0178995368 /NCGR_PEP_ID=MMETSP0795-20121207/7793_1 /TAXON_ID=88552 /ORGANISM="Amoebophrya sp., Strain Ameob2" /LENGTH=525 /DNA_ID=CAMNT_0020687677 /DNA_START=226 /DNA_END=1803 /DNA_ORIENTATION=-